ncbi:hypothetical protein GQ600_25180 [Phytophthora cactorum]|nr:hypothetical protein GQ600_25180 [Phytophthora cactorum]
MRDQTRVFTLETCHRFCCTSISEVCGNWHGLYLGNNAEHSKCRHQAFAYQSRFGQLALFLTLPRTRTTPSGIAISILGSRIPSKAEQREASLGNDCASVRLFMRQIDAFIKFALGMDPITRKRLPFQGLFGDVKAYFGMVKHNGEARCTSIF